MKTNSTDDDVFIEPNNKNENKDTKLAYEEFDNLYTRKMC